MNVLNKLFKKSPSHAIEKTERALCKLEDAIRALKRSERKLLRLEASVSRQLEHVTSLVERAKVIAEETAEDVRDGRLAIGQAERAMEALRAANEVAEKVEIPRLVAQLKEVEANSEANIALSHHRRAMASPSRSDGEL
jgi:hypothetical protein